MKKGMKTKVNVSQLIRDYAKQNPGFGPTQISNDLTAQGYKVYSALVSQALSKGTSGKPAKRGRKPKSETAKSEASTSGLDVTMIQAADSFVKAQGSVESAIETLKVYQKLSQVFGK